MSLNRPDRIPPPRSHPEGGPQDSNNSGTRWPPADKSSDSFADRTRSTNDYDEGPGPGRSMTEKLARRLQEPNSSAHGERCNWRTGNSSVANRPPTGQGTDDGRRRETRKSLVRRQSESLGWVSKDEDGERGSPALVSGQKKQPRESSQRRRASASSAVFPSGPGFFGSFDDSRYWDYAFRFTVKSDLGHLCRECKMPFSELNEAIAVRRGGRIELRYHKACFSMIADPRSQPTSSANVGKFVGSLRGTTAPEELYRKMRTRGHW